MTQHTLTPLTVKTLPRDLSMGRDREKYQVVNARGQLFKEVLNKDYADEIARVFNSHDALVEALEYIVWTHEMNGNGASNCIASLGPQCLGKARDALALAKGE